MLYFAYDGSIHGDWVSHYAARFAAAQSSQRLILIHVRNHQSSEFELEEKLPREFAMDARLNVKLVSHVLTSAGNEFKAILSVIPKGPESYLVCTHASRSDSIDYSQAPSRSDCYVRSIATYLRCVSSNLVCWDCLRGCYCRLPQIHDVFVRPCHFWGC